VRVRVSLPTCSTAPKITFFADMEQAFLGHPYLCVEPKEGMALVFVHTIWHEGAVVQTGRKYVLRGVSPS
jgi:hypothetical protein